LDAIETLAEALLGADMAKHAELAELLRENPEEFETRGLVDEYDLSQWWEDGEVDPSVFLYAFAREHGHVLTVDFQGEEEPGELQAFLVRRLASDGAPAPDFDSVESWEESVDPDETDPGEFILEKFRRLDAELRDSGQALGLLNLGWESYIVFTSPEDVLAKLRALELDDGATVQGVDDL
jgi:hypothetical protein